MSHEKGIEIPAHIWHSHGGVKAAYLVGKEPMTENYMDQSIAQVEKLVRFKPIIDKLESSIEASLKLRDQYKKNSSSWKRYNHAAHETLYILRFVVNKPRQELEHDKPRKLLEELLEEVEALE